MTAEQLPHAVKVLHCLLALVAPPGDLGAALQAAARLDGAVFALRPFEAGAEVLPGRVDFTDAKREASAELVHAAEQAARASRSSGDRPRSPSDRLV